jgi:hypothetical protein
MSKINYLSYLKGEQFAIAFFHIETSLLNNYNSYLRLADTFMQILVSIYFFSFSCEENEPKIYALGNIFHFVFPFIR